VAKLTIRFIIIALVAFMKQYQLSRSANLQMSQIQNIFTGFSYNQNIPQKYKISSDAQNSSGQSKNEKKYAQPGLIQAANYTIWDSVTTDSVWKSLN